MPYINYLTDYEAKTNKLTSDVLVFHRNNKSNLFTFKKLELLWNRTIKKGIYEQENKTSVENSSYGVRGLHSNTFLTRQHTKIPNYHFAFYFVGLRAWLDELLLLYAFIQNFQNHTKHRWKGWIQTKKYRHRLS